MNNHSSVTSRFVLFAIATISFAVFLNSASAQPATNGLILWLDASDTSSVQTNSSGYVNTWLNKAPGATNPVTFSGMNDNQTSASYNTTAPNYVTGPNATHVVNFSGNGYLDNTNFSAATPASMTVFLLAAPYANPGSYSAFMAFRQSSSVNDYQTGFNFDQGDSSSRVVNTVNVEGIKAGGGGGFNFLDETVPFKRFHLFEVDYGGGTASNNQAVTAYLDGGVQTSATGNSGAVNLNQLYVGTRAYVSGNNQSLSHNFQGQIAALLVYDHQVTSNELVQTEGYLLTYFTTNFAYESVSPASLVLSWTNAAGYSLLSSTNLITNPWTSFTGTVLTNNNKASAIIAPHLPAQFFRLMQNP